MDALGFLLGHLEVIIGKAEPAEIDHAEEDQPDEPIIWPRPQQAGHNHGADYQHATHGGRALFNAVQLSQAMDFGCSANRLTDFQRGQFANNEISKNQRAEEGGDGGGNRPERDIKENVEPNEVFAQPMEIVHHGEFSSDERRAAKCSITSSVRAARLPVLSAKSPGATMSCKRSAASDVELTTAVFCKPARVAPSAIATAGSPI